MGYTLHHRFATAISIALTGSCLLVGALDLRAPFAQAQSEPPPTANHADIRGQFRWGAEFEVATPQIQRFVRYFDLDFLEAQVRRGLAATDNPDDPLFQRLPRGDGRIEPAKYFELSFHAMFGDDVLRDYAIQPGALESLRTLDPAVYRQVIEGVDPTYVARYTHHAATVVPVTSVPPPPTGVVDLNGKPLSPAPGPGITTVVPKKAEAIAADPRGFTRSAGGIFVPTQPKDPVPESIAAGNYALLDETKIANDRRVAGNWNHLPPETQIRLIRFQFLSNPALAKIVQRLPVATKDEEGLAQFLKLRPDAPDWMHKSNFSLDGVQRQYEKTLEIALDQPSTDLDEFLAYVEGVAKTANIAREINLPTTVKHGKVAFHLHASKVDSMPAADFRAIMMRWKRLQMARLLAADPIYNSVVRRPVGFSETSLTKVQDAQKSVNLYTLGITDHGGMVNIPIIGGPNHLESKEHASSPAEETAELVRLLKLKPEDAIRSINDMTIALVNARPDILATIRSENPKVLLDFQELYPQHDFVSEVGEPLKSGDPTAHWAQQATTLASKSRGMIFEDNIEKLLAERLATASTAEGRQAILRELKTLIDEKKRYSASADEYKPVQEALRIGLENHHFSDDGSLILASSLLAEIRPHPNAVLPGDRAALLAVLRRQVLSPDDHIREAACDLVLSEFRDQLVADPHDRAAQRDIGYYSERIKLVATYLSSPDPRDVESGIEQILYKLPEAGHAFLRFADLPNQQVLDSIASHLNSLRPEDGGYTLLGSLTPRTQGELNALVGLATQLKQPQKLEILLERIRLAVREPSSGLKIDAAAAARLAAAPGATSRRAKAELRLLNYIGRSLREQELCDLQAFHEALPAPVAPGLH